MRLNPSYRKHRWRVLLPILTLAITSCLAKSPDLSVSDGELGSASDLGSAAEGTAVAAQDVTADGDDASVELATTMPPWGVRDGDEPFTELTWQELYELDLETGEPSPLLAGLDGQPVQIPGFMVPLDDGATLVREFLLVPYAGACIHVPPPPANQIVYVTMVDGFEAEMSWWDPIWVMGTLEIQSVEHAFGAASYRLEGLKTEIVQP